MDFKKHGNRYVLIAVMGMMCICSAVIYDSVIELNEVKKQLNALDVRVTGFVTEQQENKIVDLDKVVLESLKRMAKAHAKKELIGPGTVEQPIAAESKGIKKDRNQPLYRYENIYGTTKAIEYVYFGNGLCVGCDSELRRLKDAVEGSSESEFRYIPFSRGPTKSDINSLAIEVCGLSEKNDFEVLLTREKTKTCDIESVKNTVFKNIISAGKLGVVKASTLLMINHTDKSVTDRSKDLQG